MNTYAMYRSPNAGVYPRCDESVVLRKTGRRIKVRECSGARQHERATWEDENGEPYVEWFGSMHHVVAHPWGYGIDQMRSPLKDEHMTWRR